jgi:cytochrome o ubiquinol oxidase subunit 2
MILFDALAIMLTIVVPVILATFAFAWWFRASNTRATYRPGWAHSGQIELVVWFIPLLVILLLSGVIWTGSHDLDPYRPLDSKVPPLEVQVVSLDWKWLFIYPAQGIASVNALVVPAATPIHFTLTSASVMSAFFVPQLGSMIYTMNGMTDQLNLIADHPGVFAGRSSHYNGDGFSDMHFTVTAVPADRFAAWVAGVKGSGSPLDDASYRTLGRQGTLPAPIAYRSVAPTLFADIVAQRLAPTAGPPLVTPGTTEPKRKDALP